MKVKSIRIKNVRSFKDETLFIPREDYNVLIGSNGSGKSNLMNAFCGLFVVLTAQFGEEDYKPKRIE